MNRIKPLTLAVINPSRRLALLAREGRFCSLLSEHARSLSTTHLEATEVETLSKEDEATKETFFDRLGDDSLRENIVYSLSFANGLESDLASDDTFSLIDDRMKNQLRKAYSTPQTPSNYTAQILRSRLPPELELENLAPMKNDETEAKLPYLEENFEEISSGSALPKSINDVLGDKLDLDPRAIVITEVKSPFRITEVNTAWESLCGYERSECKGRDLGSLLQGPETDMSAVTALVSQLLLGEEAGTILTNYTKTGRKFRNIVRVGPLVDEMGKTVRFVGVLREAELEDIDLRAKPERGDFYETRSEKLQLPFMS